MKNEKIVPILNGYDELAELIELATRLKRTWGQLGWYINHVERAGSPGSWKARIA